MPALLAPVASFILPGGGQLLQGRFAVGGRHASLAVLLAAIGISAGVPGAGWGLFILGCWSAYESWQHRHASGRAPAADAGGVDPSRAVASSTCPTSNSPEQPDAWWRRGMRTASLLALQAVAAVEIVFFLVAAAFSVMVFDAPGSTERLDLWAFVIGMALLPVLATLLCAVAWGLHGRGRPGWAVAILAAVAGGGLAIARLLLGPERLW